jgi:catechol 2,3-dioxygenase-like lactoylglutathione lyase family enzyme
VLGGIDHVVIAVADLERAVAGFGQLGFTVVRGGRHTALGTHNALVSFSDGAYLELIAFLVESSPHPWFAAVARGGGLTDVCLRTDDLDADLASFARAGARMSDPFAMERTRPDGYAVRWMLAVPLPPSAGAVPLLIQDTTPRDERVPRERVHGNGATGIGTLTVAVEDAAAACAFYEDVLGARGEDVRQEDLGTRGARFHVGPHELQLVAPTAADGAVSRWLRARGPSPYELTLRGGPTGGSLLDAARSQGARIRL